MYGNTVIYVLLENMFQRNKITAQALEASDINNEILIK